LRWEARDLAEMITDFFWGMLERSIQSGILILLIMLIRKTIHKIPKKIICILWALAALRLIVPVTIESSFSIMPNVGEWMRSEEAAYISIQQPQTLNKVDVPEGENVLVNDEGELFRNTAALTDISSLYDQDDYAGGGDIIGVNKAAKHKGLLITFAIWAAGTGVMLLYGIYCYLRTKYLVKEAVIYKDNIRLCDRTDSAFVFGIVRPKIFIPFSLDEVQFKFILAHEKAHIERRDHISKIAGFLILSFYWFNPLVWAAYILFCHDMEMACDERVVTDLGEQEKKRYSQVLLQRSIAQRREFVSSLAFSEADVKARIKNILDYKKPGMWITIISVIVCIVFGGCSLTSSDTDEHGTEQETEEKGTDGTAESSIPDEPESGSADYAFMRKQAEAAYENIKLGLYEEGKQVDYSFDEIISGMSSDEMAARVTLQPDSNDSVELLIVSNLVYEYTDINNTEPLTAAIGGKVYYNDDGTTYDLGEVYTNGTAYPIGESSDSIYLPGGHEVARLMVDEEKKALIIYEFATVSYDENGNEMYFRLKDGELADDKDSSYFTGLGKDMTVTDFWIAAGMERLTDKSQISIMNITDFGFSAEQKVSYLSGWARIDVEQEDTDAFGMAFFNWEGDNAYTTVCKTLYYDAAGIMYRVPDAENKFVFENGKLADVDFAYGNSEYIQEPETLEGCQSQALIYELERERFTASEVEIARAAGKPVPEDEIKAKLWYVVFAKEDMPCGYVMILNDRFFTKDEVIEIARNTTFAANAWYVNNTGTES